MKDRTFTKLFVLGEDRNNPRKVARIAGPEFSVREACKFKPHFPVFIAFVEKSNKSGTNSAFAG
jgi:hypothetical protein